jgi:uncharacterized protein (UPF0332 family)
VTPDETRLLRMVKAARATLNGYKEGVNLEAVTGRTIEDLRQQACADRLVLGNKFLQVADRMTKARPPMFRIAVGRYYYAMYHTMRAVAYFKHGGDDYEKHSVLPTKTPPDFTQSAYWENELKDARYKRNEADYDPYPVEDREFRATALQLQTTAHALRLEAITYLQTNGCGHL